MENSLVKLQKNLSDISWSMAWKELLDEHSEILKKRKVFDKIPPRISGKPPRKFLGDLLKQIMEDLQKVPKKIKNDL